MNRRYRCRLVAVIMAAALTHAASGRCPAQPPSSGQGRTGIFGLEATGNRFVYVFDHSASMGEPDGRPLDEARRELLASIDTLGDSRQFHVIFYNDRLSMFTPSGQRGRPVFADDDTRLHGDAELENGFGFGDGRRGRELVLGDAVGIGAGHLRRS